MSKEDPELYDSMYNYFDSMSLESLQEKCDLISMEIIYSKNTLTKKAIRIRTVIRLYLFPFVELPLRFGHGRSRETGRLKNSETKKADS